MNLPKSDFCILRLLKILLAACLLTPLLAWSGVIFSYTAPKVFVFRALVEIAAVFYLYLALKHPAHFLPTLKKGGWGGFLLLSVLIFLIVNFLSAIFGPDFYNSFWGNLERGGGVWGLLHFVAWFLMLAGVFITDRAINKIPPFLKGGEGGFKEQDFSRQLLKISVFISGIISLLALGQYFFGLGDLMPRVDRVFSTIGNPAFLGTYLIFNIFFVGYLAAMSLRGAERQSNPMENSKMMRAPHILGARGKSVSIVYCLLLIVNFAALIFSGTRGALLGLAAGVIVFLVIIFFVSRKKIPPNLPLQREEESGSPPFLKGGEGGFKKWLMSFLIIIVVVIGSLFLFRNFALIKNNSTISRLTSFSLSDATIQSRLILWQNVWRSWKTKPWLGAGPENFESEMGPYLSPRLASFEAFSFDHAHNFIFDYGVTLGWLGLLSYLAMFVVAGWILIKRFCYSDFSSDVIPAPAFAGVNCKAGIQARIEPGSRVLRSGGASKPGMTEKKKSFFFFSVVFISMLVAYLVQNLFIFDSFVSYLMLFLVLAIVSNGCYSRPVSVIPAQAGIHVKSGSGFRLKAGMTKRTILIFFAIFIIFSLYSFNFKPILAASRANQILSLPASEAAQGAPLLKDALDLNTFASPEIVYQVVLDYIDKIGQSPVLTQNEEFYTIASVQLLGMMERSPKQTRNYIALAWLNLYFSGSDSQRTDEALDLGGKALALSPIKKDAYLILVAGYALSGQPQKAQELISQAEAIDGRMGEEVREYYEKLK